MPRKKIFPELSLEDRFDEMVVEAIQATTIEDREEISREFEAGRILMAKRIAGEFPIIQDQDAHLPLQAVLIASLVDADSRLVFIGERLKAKRLLGLVEKISKMPQYRQLMVFPQTSHRSVEKRPFSVDNSRKPVDKVVEKSVDKSTLPVDKLSTIYVSSASKGDLSPTCGEVVSLSTGPVDNFLSGSQLEKPLFKDSRPDELPVDLSTISTSPTTTTISRYI
jgi:hypothetical protein